MSEILFLVKYGEIALKKRNRGAFVRRLKDSIHAKLPDLPFDVYETFHRVFVRCRDVDREAIAGALERTFGIVSFCEALRVKTDIAEIERAAGVLAESYVAAGHGHDVQGRGATGRKDIPPHLLRDRLPGGRPPPGAISRPEGGRARTRLGSLHRDP